MPPFPNAHAYGRPCRVGTGAHAEAALATRRYSRSFSVSPAYRKKELQNAATTLGVGPFHVLLSLGVCLEA